MRRRSTTETVLLIGAALFVAAVLAVYSSGLIPRTYRIPSASMAPTLPAGAHLIATAARVVTRGEIITFRFPPNPRLVFAKRVVAVGGDVVEIRQKKLLING